MLNPILDLLGYVLTHLQVLRRIVNVAHLLLVHIELLLDDPLHDAFDFVGVEQRLLVGFVLFLLVDPLVQLFGDFLEAILSLSQRSR